MMKRLTMVIVAAALLGGCEDTPTTPTPGATTASIIFSSQVLAGGFSWRSFVVEKAGTVTVQLISLVPQNEAAVTLSLGTFSGTTCTATTSVVVKPGGTDPHISTTLAVGNYCVRVADPGVLTRVNDFSITIVIPA